jgi:hypothetical protein
MSAITGSDILTTKVVKVVDHEITGFTATLLADLRDCEEVLVSGSPIDQQDAKELRCKVTITGPTRLLAPLMDALTSNSAIRRKDEDNNDETKCSGCKYEECGKTKRANGSPVHYVLCVCENCGWTDGFREDCISGQRADGYCDHCDEPREFRVIEENTKAEG